MFKQLIPVIAFALIAGPVFAADTPAAPTTPAAEKSTTKESKHHKKHHDKKASTKPADSATAPAK